MDKEKYRKEAKEARETAVNLNKLQEKNQAASPERRKEVQEIKAEVIRRAALDSKS